MGLNISPTQHFMESAYINTSSACLHQAPTEKLISEVLFGAAKPTLDLKLSNKLNKVVRIYFNPREFVTEWEIDVFMNQLEFFTIIIMIMIQWDLNSRLIIGWNFGP